jgi:hypothetical protein
VGSKKKQNKKAIARSVRNDWWKESGVASVETIQEMIKISPFLYFISLCHQAFRWNAILAFDVPLFCYPPVVPTEQNSNIDLMVFIRFVGMFGR